MAGPLLLAALDVAVVVALFWPGTTAAALVLLVAAWALVTGVGEVAMAFSAGRTGGERALLGLTGLVFIGLGVVFVPHPGVGAATVAEVYGFFSIVSGIAALVTAAVLRQVRRPADRSLV